LLLRGGADLADRLAEEGGADGLEHLAEGACGGGLSFAYKTAVATSTGEQAIGSLKPGEKVLAYNPQTKKMEYQPILHVWINHDNDLVDLTLTTKGPARKTYETSETLHTNKKHPFLTVEQGFVPVGQLKLGMHVVEASGLIGVVTGWKSVPGVQVMYNLEVAQDHTFTVGAGQWVVHNANPDCKTVFLPQNRYPETAGHIRDVEGGAVSGEYNWAPDGSDARRNESLKGYPSSSSLDRDEWPMASAAEGGAGADIRYINQSDNRGAGSFIAKQLSNGDTFRIEIVDEWLF
jgi:hypothetical protein